jgi:hypothetical protein
VPPLRRGRPPQRTAPGTVTLSKNDWKSHAPYQDGGRRPTERGSLRCLSRGRAREWAEATLLAARLPNEVDFYSLGPDGCLVRARDDLTPEEQDGIVAAGGTGIISLRSSRKLAAAVPWVASLPSAVGRIGYAPGTPERDAAELLELLANVSYYIHEGDTRQVANFAFYAGMLWQARRDDDDAATGRRVRSGGRRGAELTTNDEAHVRWISEDKILKDRGVVSERQRARMIAQRFGEPFDTVRGVIRKFRTKQRRRAARTQSLRNVG